MYKIGDKVVYPHHGAGTVVKKEKREVLGEQREHRRIACEKRGLKIVQIRNQLRQRVHDGKTPGRNPGVALADALPRGDAREVLASRSHQRSSPASGQQAPGELCGEAQRFEMHGHQRVEPTADALRRAERDADHRQVGVRRDDAR